ncbi:STAS/SEC14 domain-containing protein [Martelella lutilitoris]|uniref:STAS/SEC14 domain-containing protein n=1 Tax=Martelella lutilitoris TaxID=2583532 RepID=A0A5C4JQ94_9HYPH|nr:STAS/SEC14 domain-containing protein [Martelella lutilitoris]TNB47490.1 STAS/SEC14 domain-containing protein [Martelella lutilitoris]
MLDKIEDLPENIIGFTIHNALSANDYQNVLLPALEEHSSSHDGLRLLLVTATDFAGSDIGSAMGGQPFRRSEPLNFKSIAIVSSNRGFTQAVQMFGMLFHADVKVFEPEQQDAAVTWLEQ